MLHLEGLDHVALAVADVESAAVWYADVLGFERRHEGMWDGVPTFIGLGKTAIALFPKRDSSRAGGRPSAVFHVAMRADRANFLAAQKELKQRGISFDFQDHEISHSIYFQDPDGNELEITSYQV